jgi:cell division FtsZ-interacting protein ZapD
MFPFQQGLSGETLRLIVDSCQHLKKLNLDGLYQILGDDIIYVILKLGKQLTTLVLHGGALTDAAYSYLKNCAR